mgnify:FL=1
MPIHLTPNYPNLESDFLARKLNSGQKEVKEEDCLGSSSKRRIIALNCLLDVSFELLYGAIDIDNKLARA